jgi:diguanylate cyclase (GGDEF)-like protein
MPAANEGTGDTERLRREFLLEAQTHLEQGRTLIARLVGDGNAALVERLAGVFHALTGAGAAFGFPEASALALEGEKLCARGLHEARTLSAAEADACIDLLDTLGARLAAPPVQIESPTAAYGPAVGPTASREIGIDVLVVEDDHAFATTVCSVIEHEGLRVRLASTLAEAEREIAGRRPDALIVDVRLPDGIVYPFVERLRAQPGGDTLPVLALSGLNALPDRVEAMRCGIDAFFTKPVDFDAVVQRLRFLLQRSRTEPARILSVEDDPQQAAHLRAVLESAGHIFGWCSDPATVEAEVANFRPHLVLMDVLLPGVSGYDLVRVLRQDERYAVLPIVFLTTETGMQERIRATASGADEFLVKPVAAPLLLTTVAARVERARLLESLLARDGLTGLLTHGAFLERAHSVVAAHRRRPQPAAVFLMLDIDHFKHVNDLHGHSTGDRVLAALGALLRRRLRQSDLIGRYGGEEFAAIVEDLDAEEAGRLARRLLAEFADNEHVAPDGTPFRVTFSAGVAAFVPGMTLAAWRETADRRLYAAKAAGRARVVTVG